MSVRDGAVCVAELIGTLEGFGARLDWADGQLHLTYRRSRRPPDELLALLAQAHDWVATVIDAEQIVARLLTHPSRGL